MSPEFSLRSRVPSAHLRAFFSHREPVSLADAEALLGRDRDWIASQIENPQAPEAGYRIPWQEVAMLVLQVWTPAELDASAGDAPGFPGLLRVSSVDWHIPLYLIKALEHLVMPARASRRDEAGPTVEAYVARLLDLMLDPDVAKQLCADREFREAFLFPETD